MDGLKQIIAANISSGSQKNDALLQALKTSSTLTGRVLTVGPNGSLPILTPLGVLELKTNEPLPRGTLVHILINPDSSITLKVDTPKIPTNTLPPLAQDPAQNLLPIKTALTNEVAKAVQTQGQLTNLFAAANAATAQNTSTLPPQVTKLLPQLLNIQIPVDENFNSETLQKAIQNSGIFLENKLAAGLNPNPTQDLKSILLQLQNALRGAVVAPPANTLNKETTMPRKGALASAHTAQISALPEHSLPQNLLKGTEESLSRIKLLQYASLEEKAGGPLSASTPALKEWQFELPFINNNQVYSVPFQIREEDHKQQNENGDIEHQKIYRLRFAINANDSGPIEANIVYQNGTISVRMFAQNADVTQKIQNHLPDLKAVLEEKDLKVEDLFAALRPGTEQNTSAPKPGYIVDHKA